MSKKRSEKINRIAMKCYIAAAIGVVIAALIMIILVMGSISGGSGNGSADGRSALKSFKDIAGESYVEELADLGEAKKSEDLLTYLTSNSVYVFDDEAVEIYAQSYITAAESTAQAKGISAEKLIVEEMGYESIEAYREEAKELTISFIKERLAVYEAAEQKGIRITEKEYKEYLSVYANKFGYATSTEFEYACTPSSIGNEMLYDKTLQVIGK